MATCRTRGLVLRSVLAMTLVTACAWAEPCTLYKAADVEAARRNVKRYKWAQGIVNRWKRTVADVMNKDRAFLDRMIDELTPWPTYGPTWTRPPTRSTSWPASRYRTCARRTPRAS